MGVVRHERSRHGRRQDQCQHKHLSATQPIRDHPGQQFAGQRSSHTPGKNHSEIRFRESQISVLDGGRKERHARLSKHKPHVPHVHARDDDHFPLNSSARCISQHYATRFASQFNPHNRRGLPFQATVEHITGGPDDR